MSKVEKYQGIIPAFYACYEEDGKVSKQRTRELARHMADKGVKGLYVCGSSGECIYLSKKERKKILEIVMDEVGGELTVIAHVACNNTEDSEKLIRRTAWNWRHTQRVWALMRLRPFRRFISIYPIMLWRSTGTIFLRQRRIRILSSTIFLSCPVPD